MDKVKDKHVVLLWPSHVPRIFVIFKSSSATAFSSTRFAAGFAYK